MNAIEGINALGQRERERAIDAARARIAGPEPQPDDFTRRVYSKYPPGYVQRMRRLGYALLIPAFTGSAIRIFVAAFETNAQYLTGSAHPTQITLQVGVAVLVALMSVLLAESGQVAFTLWASSIDADAAAMQTALKAAAWACMAFALAANVYIVKPYTQWADSIACALAWIETLLPPVLVLIAANVLKTLALNDIENRHAARMDYEMHHAAWLARKTQAASDAGWMQALANELRDALRHENRRSYAKVRALTTDDWRALVLREMAADQWYALPVAAAAPASTHESAPALPAENPTPEPTPTRRVRALPVGSSNSNGKHTGEFANAVRATADGSYMGVCPHCGWTSDAKASARSAKAALIAHKRSCTGITREPAIIHVAEQVIEGVQDA